MEHYVELERKVIESMTNKGHQTPYKTRRKGLRVLSILTGLASTSMLATYVFFKLDSGEASVENIEMWSLPFFIMMVMLTMTSRKRIQAIDQLQREHASEQS